MCKYTLIGGLITFALIWQKEYLYAGLFAVIYAGCVEIWHYFKNGSNGG